MIRRSWPQLLLVGALLAGMALVWLARDAPRQVGVFQVDALNTFFLLVLLAGAALAFANQGPSRHQIWHIGVLAGVLVTTLFVTSTPLIMGAYALLALLDRPVARATASAQTRLQAAGRALLAAPMPLAAVCLGLGYGTLALNGAWRYDERTAGAALNGFVFWFTLLAALVALVFDHPPANRHGTVGQNETRNSCFYPFSSSMLRLAWLYPLVRLYSLGPWNPGWSFAALLLGGALGLWMALLALTTAGDFARARRVWQSFAALTLAGFGLSTSAGVAAGCYGMLACLLLDESRPPLTQDRTPTLLAGLFPWLISSALPLAAPFVATWMLVGAATASGVTALAGGVWLAMLLNSIAQAIHPPPNPSLRWGREVASVLLGVGAPLVVLLLIEPVVKQLQGGLTPYGDIAIWPWVGLAMLDSARGQVAALPSVAVAGLMVVLVALVYLIARLHDSLSSEADLDAQEGGFDATLLRFLREEVPWLGRGSPPDEERGVDSQ